MALPKAYLTSVKNLGNILNAMKTAKAPPKFTHRFLKSLGFKSTGDRLILGVLKSLGFLQDDGKPTSRYYKFLDQTQSDRVLAEGIREAFADLFQIHVHANKLSKTDIVNKFKTLSQGQLSGPVLDKMGTTFTALVKLADFESEPLSLSDQADEKTQESEKGVRDDAGDVGKRAKLGGLVYNIEIVLPESRDPAVYDALFRSLKEHLL